MKHHLLLGLLFFIMINTTQAQSGRDYMSIAVGPAILYGENTGYFSKLRVRTLPAISISYNRELHQKFDLRTTLGTQFFDGAGTQASMQKKWAGTGQAYDVKGQAYYVDVMPTYNFTPDLNIGKYKISYYAGVGMGLMHVEREAKISEKATETDGGQTDYISSVEKQRTTAIYFPVRAGLSTNLTRNWDFGLEWSVLTAASTNLDGNNTRHNSIRPDMLLQFQFMAKRDLFPNYKKRSSPDTNLYGPGL